MRLRLKGWGSPNSNEGTYTVVLYIYKYFVTVAMILTRKGDFWTDSEIADLTGVDHRRVNQA